MDFGRFGVREICNVTFRPLQAVDFGSQHFDAYEPCLFMDTATTSTIEGAATTVYAQGGQGNPRLIAWEGEKTVTVTITDALLSSVSLAMLTGAGVVTGKKENSGTYLVHMTADQRAKGGVITLPDLASDEKFSTEAAYVVVLNSAGGVKHYCPGAVTISEAGTVSLEDADPKDAATYADDICRVDYYITKEEGVTEFNITADNFAGYYYIEADTLFRDEATGADFAASFIIPRGKIQTNWTFTMASSGDPSTFDFTIDAFPGYVRGGDDKVLVTIQMPETASEKKHDYSDDAIHGHESDFNQDSKDALTGTPVTKKA